jgi:hypothetical protein
LSRDPLEEEGGVNLYCTTRNDLLGNYDSLGLIILPTWNAWSSLPTRNEGQQVGTIHSRPIDTANPISSEVLTHVAGGYADHFFIILDDGTKLTHGGGSDTRSGDITVPLRIPEDVDPQQFKDSLKKNWPDPGSYNTLTNNCRQGMNNAIKESLKETTPKVPPKPKRPWWLPVPVVS